MLVAALRCARNSQAQGEQKRRKNRSSHMSSGTGDRNIPGHHCCEKIFSESELNPFSDLQIAELHDRSRFPTIGLPLPA